MRRIQAVADDPVWVRARYEEAKQMVEDIRGDLMIGCASLESDLRERLEDFWLTTFMDRCTTFGIDCGCNTHDAQRARVVDDDAEATGVTIRPTSASPDQLRLTPAERRAVRQRRSA